jgi:hypothetical protein
LWEEGVKNVIKSAEKNVLPLVKKFQKYDFINKSKAFAKLL